MGMYDDVYAAFAEATVPYVVVGGMAVVLSGHVRATVDLDVIVDLRPDPALRAMLALQALGLRPRVPVEPADFANPAIREDWIRNKHMQVLSFFDPQQPAREVDVFVTNPIDFDVLSAAAVRMNVGGHSVPVASLLHLIELKSAAGRPRDLEDIRAYRASSMESTNMTGDVWDRATFAGTEQAQAEVIAGLTPDARVALLEDLIEVARSSGALQRAREEKQRALDLLWRRSSGDHESAPASAAGDCCGDAHAFA